jgi:hypothetical protein
MSAPKTKTKYTSKGERNNTDRALSNSIRRERSPIEFWQHKQKAWLKGRNPWIVTDNPNTAETNKKKIRVRAETLWGDPRKGYMQGSSKD